MAPAPRPRQRRELRLAVHRGTPGGDALVRRHGPPSRLDHERRLYAITGGYVVRDPGLPTLAGRYVYGDAAPGLAAVAPLRRRQTTAARPRFRPALSSFGEDACGRLYAASVNGAVYRIQDGAPTPCTFPPPPAGRPAPTPPRRG